MAHYYNEFEPRLAAWLRELMADGLIPKGDVDTRSIVDVRPTDVRGYTQCHFFAGIGGWAKALRLAHWPEEREAWTGSCPCQPLSCAGKGLGHADERHLWPAFYRLIAECRPAIVFGEQVASKAGREWLAGIRADLEGMGYACGGADLPAACVKAPQLRQRLFWMAYAQWGRPEQRNSSFRGVQQPHPDCSLGRLGNSDRAGCGEPRGTVAVQPKQSAVKLRSDPGFWDDAIWHLCQDNKYRRIPPQPGLFPLAARIRGRVGLLRGAGNAIVPQVAGAFISACWETITETKWK